MIQKIILLLFILFLINYFTENKIINIIKNKIYSSSNIKLLNDNTIYNIILFFKQYFKSNDIIIMNKLYYVENDNKKYFYNIILNNNNNLYNIDFVLFNDKINISNIYQLPLNNTNQLSTNNTYDDDDIPSIISLSD
jgi:hypothetical protein